MVVACCGRALQIFRQTLKGHQRLEPRALQLLHTLNGQHVQHSAGRATYVIRVPVIQHDASKSGPRSLILRWVAGFPTKELLTNRVQAKNGTFVPAQL
jgi:hypothetical protein